jgi:hypothetical protein
MIFVNTNSAIGGMDDYSFFKELTTAAPCTANPKEWFATRQYFVVEIALRDYCESRASQTAYNLSGKGDPGEGRTVFFLSPAALNVLTHGFGCFCFNPFLERNWESE